MKKIIVSVLFISSIMGIFYLFKKDGTTFGYIKKEKQQSVKQDLLAGMSLDEKIGQMLIGGFNGSSKNQELEDLVQKYKIGGFNLLERNIQNKNQLKKLSSDIQTLSANSGGRPVFIAIDQEGGPISRIKFLSEQTAQGQIQNVDQATIVAQNRAKELKDIGLNMIFSPLLDYVSDARSYLYPRVFHAEPDQIPELGAAMISGYATRGILAVPKHFPGYGNIFPDPHKREARFSGSSQEYNISKDVFKKTLETNKVHLLMTAHIIVPFVDSTPATLSYKFISKILLEEWGYKGLVVSDDLGMASALQNKKVGEVAVQAILAGNDLLIETMNPEDLPSVIDNIKKAVASGVITQERIDNSARKIVELKQEYLK